MESNLQVSFFFLIRKVPLSESEVGVGKKVTYGVGGSE
jgi:hypothetical protein